MTRRLAVSIVPALVAVTLAASWPGGPVHFDGTDSVAAQARVEGTSLARQDAGIPVTDPEVVASCGSCHRVDDRGMMGRLSYLRKTPEGWQRSLLRMVSLQGVELDPEVARRIVRYLSNEHGLAPEELRPVLWEAERRTVPNEAPNEIIRETCTACHSVGRILTQRRTDEEWVLLTQTHRAYYPLIDNQVYRDGEGTADDPFPVDEAVDYLAEALPLMTPDWRLWSPRAQAPRLGGSWTLEGWETGKGPIFGTVEISAVADAAGEFTTRSAYTYARDGSTVTREGEVLVYTGYQWRGRSQETGGSSSGSGIGAGGELREVMFVEPDWSEIYGRWFTGAYDELGLDVKLRRVGADPVLSGVYPESVRRDSGPMEIRIYGASLPEGLSAGDVDLGSGLEVTAVLGGTSESFDVRVSVAPEAEPGPRDLRLGYATLRNALIVFDEVARVSVEPSMGMARVGGAGLPKQYERFEAVGYAAGPDGEPGTDDDQRLGLVDVSWEVEEYPVSFDDDDVEFVGQIQQDGVFVPAEDGPNPERTGDRNNVGDVWVRATYMPPDGAGPPLEARGQLVVTVPLYLRWDLSVVTEDLGADG